MSEHQQVEVTLQMNLWIATTLDEEDIGVLVRDGIYSTFKPFLTPIKPEARLDVLSIREEAAIFGPQAPAMMVVIEGGLVQHVVTHNPALEGLRVAVIDYDTEGADDADVFEVLQDDGDTATAVGHIELVSRASISTDHFTD